MSDNPDEIGEGDALGAINAAWAQARAAVAALETLHDESQRGQALSVVLSCVRLCKEVEGNLSVAVRILRG